MIFKVCYPEKITKKFDETEPPDDWKEAQYKEWKDSLDGKSVLEHLAEASIRQEEGFAGMALNIMDLIWLHTQKKIENKLIKEGDNDRFSLFLQFEIDEHTLGLGNSNKLEIYHCKLLRYVKVNEKNDDGLPEGVYEFKIINLPKVGFSRPLSMKNIGGKYLLIARLLRDKPC